MSMYLERNALDAVSGWRGRTTSSNFSVDVESSSASSVVARTNANARTYFLQLTMSEQEVMLTATNSAASLEITATTLATCQA